jgi:F0F1-type ATP synthase assembly protein I
VSVTEPKRFAGLSQRRIANLLSSLVTTAYIIGIAWALAWALSAIVGGLR